jgi:hypothetical protein
MESLLEEVLNEISFSRFLEQVDRKIWRVHTKSEDDTILEVDDYGLKVSMRAPVIVPN